jgi:hypothetical protein
MTFSRIIAIVVLIWVFIYTVSYGRWTWKRKNRFGAVMVVLLAVVAFVFPLYALFFRQG